MLRLAGTETEYGLSRFDAPSCDFNLESDALVRVLSESRDIAAGQEQADVMLPNGCRVYTDGGHPEYCTPECRGLFELVAHEKAGEVLLREAMEQRRKAGAGICLYKNNTDFAGHSYGCHENYLLPRSVPFDRLVDGLVPFLVTRQIFAGTGKLGWESVNEPIRCDAYQISQRSDFFSFVTTADTTGWRGLVNTRDEPHADPRRYRRLHLILGDSNRSQFAMALKMGSTDLTLGLVEEGIWPADWQLANPVSDLHAVSRDAAWRWPIRLADGRQAGAVDVQRAYCELAWKRYGGSGAETDWVLAQWRQVLDDLAADPLRCGDRLDWVAKWKLLELFRRDRGADWSDARLQSIDLAYHDLDTTAGLFDCLQETGVMRQIVAEPAIAQAMRSPPGDTRALLRGICADRFRDSIQSVCWDRVCFTSGSLRLNDLMDPAEAARQGAAAAQARRWEDLAMLCAPLWERKKMPGEDCIAQ